MSDNSFERLVQSDDEKEESDKQNNSSDSDKCQYCFFRCLFCCPPMPSSTTRQGQNVRRKSIHNDQAQPFCIELPKHFEDGAVIRIRGVVARNCSQFAVNLKSTRENGDVVYHFNPRIIERYIVRNHRVNGTWGDEETTGVFKLEDFCGKFKISILLTKNTLYTSINGRHFCMFDYRLPLSKAHFLEVTGNNVEVTNIEFSQTALYPADEQEVEEEERKSYIYKIPILEGDYVVEYNTNERRGNEKGGILEVPLTAVLPTSLEPGWQLKIHGRVKLLPTSFFINLQDGPQIWPHPAIPLHINPRFNVVNGNNVLVRNAWYNGGWGPEERTPSFPFLPGQNFIVLLRKEAEYFSFWVDGQLMAEFRFRGANDVNTLYIHGDVFINQVVMEKHLTDVFHNIKGFNNKK